MNDETQEPTEEQLAEAAKLATASPNVSKSEQKAQEARMKAVYAEQPKEKIRVHPDQGPQRVVINGTFHSIPAGVYVEVPAQVAEILRNSGRI